MALRHCQKPKILLLVAIAAYSIASSIASLVFAVTLRQRFQDMQLNAVGDSEKVFFDRCLRDFMGLPSSDPTYQSTRRGCAKDFLNEAKYHWLPLVRLAVDQRVCDQDDLCSTGDPQQCADEVTACYSLMNQARHVSKTTEEQSALESQYAESCTRAGRWDNYEHKVQLTYCMWKHASSAGVCTNNVRTTCPEDESCCPVAQNYTNEAGADVATGPYRYACRQSATLGIFCQHVDYTASASTDSTDAIPCTEISCPDNFEWCHDLVDVSGLCVGQPCQDYHHSLGYTALFITCAALGLFLDISDVAIWFCYPKAGLPKAAANAVGLFLKLAALVLVMAAGIRQFVDEVIERACFNPAGNAMLDEDIKGLLTRFWMAMLCTAMGSLCLAPLSALWVGHFSELPYRNRVIRNA